MLMGLHHETQRSKIATRDAFPAASDERWARLMARAVREGTCLGRPVSASWDGATGNGSRPSWQWNG